MHIRIDAKNQSFKIHGVPAISTASAGVEAVLVLALASEWDANRRGVRNYPIEAAGGMA